MGVLGETVDQFDRALIIEDLLEELLEGNLFDQALPETPRKTRTKLKHRLPKHGVMPIGPMKTQSSQDLGRGKFRRYENMSYLMNLADGEDFGEISIHDFIPEQVSAFTQLLMDRESMKIWNDFLNHSDEGQQHILEQTTKKYTDSDIPKLAEGKKATRSFVDQRTVHPAFTPEECYQRINGKLRNVLSRKHLPWGLLAHLEEEVTSFFIEWPRSVFISYLKSSFQRLMLHAICEYLDLFSQSFDQNSQRHTQVENMQEEFSPPSMTLTNFLEQKS